MSLGPDSYWIPNPPALSSVDKWLPSTMAPVAELCVGAWSLGAQNEESDPGHCLTLSRTEVRTAGLTITSLAICRSLLGQPMLYNMNFSYNPFLDGETRAQRG